MRKIALFAGASLVFAMALVVNPSTSKADSSVGFFFDGRNFGITIDDGRRHRDHRDYRGKYKRNHHRGQRCWRERRGWVYDVYLGRKVPRYVRVCSYR